MDDPTTTVLVLLGAGRPGGRVRRRGGRRRRADPAAGAAARAAGRGAGPGAGHQQARLDLRHDGELRDVLPPGPARPADLPAADAARVRRLGRAGALVASHIPRSAFEPIVLVVLIVVGALRAAQAAARRGDRAAVRRAPAHRRRDGHRAGRSASTTARSARAPAASSSSRLVGLLGYSFLEASAKARLANWATNLAALCVFVPAGRGALEGRAGDGACNLVGGYVGARTAVARGTRFVRVFFIVVVSAFIVRIGGDVLGLW